MIGGQKGLAYLNAKLYEAPEPLRRLLWLFCSEEGLVEFCTG